MQAAERPRLWWLAVREQDQSIPIRWIEFRVKLQRMIGIDAPVNQVRPGSQRPPKFLNRRDRRRRRHHHRDPFQEARLGRSD